MMARATPTALQSCHNWKLSGRMTDWLIVDAAAAAAKAMTVYEIYK